MPKMFGNFRLAALGGVEVSQVVEALRMARPEHLAASLQRFPVERLRLAVAALGVVEESQVIKADQRSLMARPKHLAVCLQHFPIERLRLAVAALGIIKEGQIC
jgi:hypothetical protein